MYCGYCLVLTPVRLTRVSETQPLGYKGGLGPVVFEAVHNRRSRSRLNRDSEEVFNVEDYPMTPDRTEDKGLRYLANQGIVLSVNDENGDSTEEEGGH